MKFLSNFSIQQKVYSSFGVIMVVMAIIVVNTLVSLSVTDSQVKSVTSEIQPALIAATQLEKALQEASASIGFVMLTNNKEHKLRYQQLNQAVKKAMLTLTQSPLVKKPEKLNTQVKKLGIEVKDFVSYEQRVIKLSENRLFNLPALNYARETLNPTNSEISQVLNSMIQSEADEESNDQRKRLLIDLAMLKNN